MLQLIRLIESFHIDCKRADIVDFQLMHPLPQQHQRVQWWPQIGLCKLLECPRDKLLVEGPKPRNADSECGWRVGYGVTLEMVQAQQ